jgi:hypothetical protein
MDKRGHVQLYVNVPVTSSDDYFQKSHTADDSFIKINGLNDSNHYAVVYLATYLSLHYPVPILEAFCAVGTPVTEYMSETKITAMSEDADIFSVQEQKILQHMRCQFGTNTFVTRTYIQMVCKGRTPVKTECVMHAHKDGKEEEEEYLDHSYKDTRKEIEVHFARQLTGARIDLTMLNISTLDLIGGASHSCGAM